jgi:arsenate reductase
MLRIYSYEKCGTCRNAMQFLADHGVKAEVLPIKEKPPNKADLKRMLALLGGEKRKLFNTSGLQYKALQLKEKLPAMSEAEALDLLSKNGMLVKRPFVLVANGGTVGFKAEKWRELIGGK